MLSIDRFEEDFAVCIDEQGKSSVIEKFRIETGAKEGDYICFKDGRYYVDKNKTKSERDKILALQDEVFQ